MLLHAANSGPAFAVKLVAAACRLTRQIVRLDNTSLPAPTRWNSGLCDMRRSSLRCLSRLPPASARIAFAIRVAASFNCRELSKSMSVRRGSCFAACHSASRRAVALTDCRSFVIEIRNCLFCLYRASQAGNGKQKMRRTYLASSDSSSSARIKRLSLSMAFLWASLCKKLSVPASIGCLLAATATPPTAAAQAITCMAMAALRKCARSPFALAGATCLRCACCLRGGERPAVFTSERGRFAVASSQPVFPRHPGQGSRPRFLQLALGSAVLSWQSQKLASSERGNGNKNRSPPGPPARRRGGPA